MERLATFKRTWIKSRDIFFPMCFFSSVNWSFNLRFHLLCLLITWLTSPLTCHCQSAAVLIGKPNPFHMQRAVVIKTNCCGNECIVRDFNQFPSILQNTSTHTHWKVNACPACEGFIALLYDNVCSCRKKKSHLWFPLQYLMLVSEMLLLNTYWDFLVFSPYWVSLVPPAL